MRRSRRFWFGLTCGLAGIIAALLVAATAFQSSDSDGSQKTNADAEEKKQRDPDRKLTPAEIVAEKKQRSAKSMQEFEQHVKPFLKKYCIECHGPDEQSAKLAFHKFTTEASLRQGRRTWEKITRALESGAMPPEEQKHRPNDSERKRVVRWIDALFRIDCRLVDDPGRVTIRRLNRNEYNNTIRDLVGVDFHPAQDFPSDDVGYGFDNIGDVLSLPPLLMEKYLNAAETIAAKAILIADPKKSNQRFAGRKLRSTAGGRIGPRDFHHLSSTGEVYATVNFPRTGDYLLRAEAAADQAGPELAKMEFRVNNRKVKVFKVKGYRKPAVYEFKIKLKKGRKKFSAAFINDYYKPDAPRPRDRDRNLAVRFLEVRGPIGLPPVNLPETHKRILFTRPGKNKTVKQAAREILSRFATRAFRRPALPDEIDRLVKLVEFVMAQKDGFDRAIQVAVQSVLVSPHFLFRVESDKQPDNPQFKHAIRDYELATRLSYFLWSTMPDEELFRLAAQGELHKPQVLAQQVRRMLQNPRVSELVKNFGGQWLNLRILDTVSPDPKRFPTFNAKLRHDMKRETELFISEVIRRNHSILDFLDGKFTFINSRLAKHYGIKGIRGKQFRKVILTGNQRAGVLTHASILTITSNPTRTSPVKRGKWILINIFDTPPPPPPPGVPELDEKKIASGELSLRKQFEIHRKNPICASCHNTMDPLGFGFENFDAVGKWRDKEGRNPVDASGKLPGGGQFRGPIELIRILKKRKADFARCFTRKLLTFALGRGLEDYDKCAVDKIVKNTANGEYRFESIVQAIVNSDPFLMRRGDTRNSRR